MLKYLVVLVDWLCCFTFNDKLVVYLQQTCNNLGYSYTKLSICNKYDVNCIEATCFSVTVVCLFSLRHHFCFDYYFTLKLKTD